MGAVRWFGRVGVGVVFSNGCGCLWLVLPFEFVDDRMDDLGWTGVANEPRLDTGTDFVGSRFVLLWCFSFCDLSAVTFVGSLACDFDGMLVCFLLDGP